MNPAEPTFADWIAVAALAAFCLTLLALFATDARRRYARPPADERDLLKAKARAYRQAVLDAYAPPRKTGRLVAWLNREPVDLDRADRCGPQCCRDQRNTH